MLRLTWTAIAVMAATGFGAWIRAGSRSREATSTFVVRPVERRVDTTISATGVVRVIDGREVRVGSRVSGTVSRLNVRIGSPVHRGDLIAEIDPREMRARLAEARAAAEVDAIDHRRAVLALQRAERLARDGIIPDSQIDELRAASAAAKAREQRDLREVDVMDTQLEATRIYAPIDGTVSSVSTEQGETVAASFAAPTFITITDRSALEVAALVDEHDIGNVRPGLLATFNVEAFPAREYNGHVKRIAPKGTIVSGVVNYEVVIDPDGTIAGLSVDMTATVTVHTGSRMIVVVPAGAVQRNGEENVVYVQTSEGIERRGVLVGERFGNQVEVRNLTVSDRVVIRSSRRSG
jgi:HlyD family secretion protein